MLWSHKNTAYARLHPRGRNVAVQATGELLKITVIKPQENVCQHMKRFMSTVQLGSDTDNNWNSNIIKHNYEHKVVHGHGNGR